MRLINLSGGSDQLHVWVVNSLGGVYVFNSSTGHFEGLGVPGCATNISAGNGENPWITGCQTGGEHEVYRWLGGDFGWALAGSNFLAHQVTGVWSDAITVALHIDGPYKWDHASASWVSLGSPGSLRWVDFTLSGIGIGTDGKIYNFYDGHGWLEPQSYTGPFGCQWIQVTPGYALDSCGHLYQDL